MVLPAGPAHHGTATGAAKAPHARPAGAWCEPSAHGRVRPLPAPPRVLGPPPRRVARGPRPGACCGPSSAGTPFLSSEILLSTDSCQPVSSGKSGEPAGDARGRGGRAQRGRGSLGAAASHAGCTAQGTRRGRRRPRSAAGRPARLPRCDLTWGNRAGPEALAACPSAAQGPGRLCRGRAQRPARAEDGDQGETKGRQGGGGADASAAAAVRKDPGRRPRAAGSASADSGRPRSPRPPAPRRAGAVTLSPSVRLSAPLSRFTST